MANLDLIAVTVQQLLSHTTSLLQQDVQVVIHDETLEALERDMRRAMMQLRRYRNKSIATPINRLPTELLPIIFGHLRKPPAPLCIRYLMCARSNSYEPLTSIMLVCHKWYTVASQAPSLWTDIDVSTSDVLLSRSLCAPIYVSGDLSTTKEWLEATVEDHGARIRELDICVEQGSIPALKTIIAVDMPRLRTLSLYSYLHLPPFSADVPVSFPALKALMMVNVLFVPSPSLTQGHAIPQLTHLNLGGLEAASVSNILDLLRHTPSLEVLHISPCDRLVTPPPPSSCSSVALPRLREVLIQHLASIDVHRLVCQLEVPSLTFFHFYSPFVSSGSFPSKPLTPSALQTWTVNRMALTVRHTRLRVVSFGPDVSLGMDIYMNMNTGVEHAEPEILAWKCIDLPATLPLSTVEELHVRTDRWDTAPTSENLFALAAHMPAVSTLIIKHDASRDSLDTEGVIGLGRTVAALLASDHPVLFPALTHLELIVSDIPVGLCSALAPALAQRAQDGRRMRTLRIHMNTQHVFRWRVPWLQELPGVAAYAETGVFHYVEVGEIYPKLRANMSHVDYVYGENDGGRLGWGKWKDCVKRAKHDYWKE